MEIGELRGILSTLPDSTKQATLLQLMIDEAIKTSAIEGEFYSRQDIMSSIKNKIGLYPALEQIKDKQARGIGELIVKVHKNYNAKLTEALLQEWHKILFQKSSTIRAGKYRISSEPMVIVSGSYGRETVHYQAHLSETFYVVEGRLEFQLSDRVVVVQTGESIDLPPYTAHTFKNMDETPCRWLNIHSPKGFLSFFETFGINASDENAFEKSVDTEVIQSVIQQAADYDMHLVEKS